MSDPATLAMALPDVDEGISCAGTALECRTFLVRKKAFLFLSKDHIRLKLGPSIADAKKRGFAAGAAGWVKLNLDELPPRPLLKAWIAESHSLFAESPRTKKAATSKPARRSRS